jgi:hypothetical protein
MTGDQLDAEDQIKLDTWFQVMLLLEHYRAVTFEPMYARGRRTLASAEDREILSDKLESVICNFRNDGKKRSGQIGVTRWSKTEGRAGSALGDSVAAG